MPYSYHNAIQLLESFILTLLNRTDIISTPNLFPSPVQNALKYINIHFKEDITLSDISQMVYLSDEYFSRKFHEYTGQTFKSYLLFTRLNYAKRLLLNTNKSVSEIASDSGFHYASHFTRTFKYQFNLSPAEYRKKFADSQLIPKR